MAIQQRREESTTSTSEAEDSYERATAFLSGWIEDSFLVPTATAKIGHKDLQHQQPFSQPQPVPDLPLPSRSTLRRRDTFSSSSDDGDNANEGAINSLVHSLQTSLMMHEHQNQNRSSQRGITSSPSSSCIGVAFNGIADLPPPPPFGARPTATQQDTADAPSRRPVAPSLRSTRRRSTGDDTARPKTSDIKNEHGGGSKHHHSSSSKSKKSSKRPRRRTFDCDRSFTSSKSSCASIAPSNPRESLLRNRSASIDEPTEDELQFSVSMSSLHDRRRSSSRHRVHWSNRSDDDLLSPTPARDHGGHRSKCDPPTMVVSLPWTDHAGNVGHYTGEVNTLIQPHGSGALQYDCGRVLKGLWNNGNPTTSTASNPRSSPVLVEKGVKRAVTADTVKSDVTAPTPRGVPSSRKIGEGDEKKSSSKKQSNQSAKTKSSRKKSRGHTDKGCTEDKPSTKTTKPTSSTHSAEELSLDHLSELDGPPLFDLGDTYHSTKYQIIESNPSKALNHINQLRVHDFAWILRSSREWTYAIIADFPVESGKDASIRFVIDKMGNTKTLKMKHWAKCIRLVDHSN